MKVRRRSADIHRAVPKQAGMMLPGVVSALVIYSLASAFAADEEAWHIPSRNTYTMSADHFMPYGSVTPGGNGLCRYSYYGDDVDPFPILAHFDLQTFATIIID